MEKDRGNGRPGGRPKLFVWLRRRFITGLVVLLPTVLTVWLLWKIFRSVDGVLRPLAARYPLLDIPGLGVLAVLLIVLAVGISAANLLGRRFIRLLERALGRVPLVNRMYLTLKQMSEVFLQEKRTAFRRAVMIEYPRRGLYSVGFVTSTWRFRDETGRERAMVNLFLPTTPNPTSGLFLILPEEDTEPMGCSIEEAVKMVISGGAVTPSDLPVRFAASRRAGDRDDPRRD
ncbi:MAG: DUF502 domain-containing protein [Candidatus Krumholzibacteria bacterium]|nr:DUF502 domain-containing protein [Candidatus Krumholzibacteria bacterium]